MTLMGSYIYGVPVYNMFILAVNLFISLILTWFNWNNGSFGLAKILQWFCLF